MKVTPPLHLARLAYWGRLAPGCFKLPNKAVLYVDKPHSREGPGGAAGGRTRSSMPSFLSCSTTEPRLERRISGYVCSCRSFLKLASVYSRKHLPGCVRPARPARWCALACAHADNLLHQGMPLKSD